MKISHPRHCAILDEIAKRCRAAEINFYRIELLPDDSKGWDARFDVANGNAPHELTFLRIVNAVRDEYGSR